MNQVETLPSDYEPCGTCGYDHIYDGDNPSVMDKIVDRHVRENDVLDLTLRQSHEKK